MYYVIDKIALESISINKDESIKNVENFLKRWKSSRRLVIVKIIKEVE